MNEELLVELLRDRVDLIHVPPASAAAARRRARQRDRRLRVGLGVGSVGVLIGGVALVAGDDDQQRSGFPGGSDGSVSSSTEPSPTTPVSSLGQAVTVPAVAEVSRLARDLTKGDSGDDVKALQERLVQLGFDTHGVDGQFSAGTEMAVWAFEGAVLGRDYADQTGVVTDEMWQTMQGPITFQARRAEVEASATHVEIDLPTQVLIVFRDEQVRLITHISSGSGETWCDVLTINTDDLGNPINPPKLQDICGVSKTPGGVFRFYRGLDGHRIGGMGGMENPIYFNYGIAVYGSDSVPALPASHGGIRIPQWIATYFPSLVHADQTAGDLVYVWGTDGKQPEEYTRDESLPMFSYPNPDSTLVATTT